MDCNRLCTTLWLLWEKLDGGRVCIVFPWVSWDTSDCDILIIADSAIRWADQANHPDVVILVTDGDGGVKNQAPLAEYSMVVAHFHGDNPWLMGSPVLQRALQRRVLVPTAQVVVPEGTALLAPFGFTDGDRSVLIAAALGSSIIEYNLSKRILYKNNLSIKLKKLIIFNRMVDLIIKAFGYDCS